MSDPSAPNPPAPVLLLERLKLAHAECRAEISLGWDRQKFFLGINPSLTVLIAVAAPEYHAAAVRAALVGAAAIALVGTLVVHRGHTRYQAARATLQRLEDELGIQDLQTTGGQREARGGLRLEAFRIVDLMVGVFLLLAGLDIWLALTWSGR